MLAAADSSKKEQPTKHISSSRQPGWKKQPLWSELKGKKAEDGKEAKHKAELEQEELPRLRQLFKFNLTTLNCSSIFLNIWDFSRENQKLSFLSPVLQDGGYFCYLSTGNQFAKRRRESTLYKV